MASAKKCDRCGKFYDIYGPNTASSKTVTLADANVVDMLVFPKYGDAIRIKRFELCPICAAYVGAVLSTPPYQPPEV